MADELIVKTIIRTDKEKDENGNTVEKGTTSTVYGKESDGNGGVDSKTPHGHLVVKDGEIVALRDQEGNQIVQTGR